MKLTSSHTIKSQSALIASDEKVQNNSISIAITGSVLSVHGLIDCLKCLNKLKTDLRPGRSDNMAVSEVNALICNQLRITSSQKENSKQIFAH